MIYLEGVTSFGLYIIIVIHISYIYLKEEKYMKIFSVCARVDYNGQDVIDLGLFKSSNAALLAMKTFIDNHVRSASKISIELFAFSDDTLNDDASLPYTTINLLYNPSLKKYDDLNPVLFV